MWLTYGNAAHLKIVAHLEKFDTFAKVRHTWGNAAHLKIAPRSKKCGTLEKVWHTWRNAAHLKKCGTLWEMRHT